MPTIAANFPLRFFVDGRKHLLQDLCRRRSAVEPYEISRYGTLLAWTEELGLDDAAELLKQTWKRRKRPMRR
jgi:ferritin-like metal-binding protein YciE